MPFVLFTVLTSALRWLLPRLLAVVGVVAFSQVAVTPIFDWLKDQLLAKLNSLPADAVTFLAFVGVFDAISIVFSAYAMAISIKAGKAAFAKSGASRV
ncbi:DUF2523 family protein [Pseudomonas sp.]|jgi:hypothetical protein|uniref:DUF2523 family protein n=1 Tax=Pseudomonas sp. TaxID=306 RepID=UPI0037CCB15C